MPTRAARTEGQAEGAARVQLADRSDGAAAEGVTVRIRGGADDDGADDDTGHLGLLAGGGCRTGGDCATRRRGRCSSPPPGAVACLVACNVAALLACVAALLAVGLREDAAPPLPEGNHHGGDRANNNNNNNNNASSAMEWAPLSGGALDLSYEACNNRGILYRGAASACSCFQCFAGPGCIDFDRNCTVRLNGGDPLVMEEFWVNNPAALTVTLPSYRLGYGYSALPELDAAVRELHAAVGNAVTEGKRIVFGVGSTQLLNAALFALANGSSPEPAAVYAKAPYYSGFNVVADWPSAAFKHPIVSDRAPEATDQQQVIELVTSPNNPDGRMQTAAVPGAQVVYDHAYLWPHFTPITRAVDTAEGEMRLFTLSKLTGHAGTRLGWALVRDEALARRMEAWVYRTTIGVPWDSQQRAAALLRSMLQQPGGGTIAFAHRKLEGRWARLRAALDPGERFQLQQLEPAARCRFLDAGGEPRPPTPAYAWIRCVQPEDVQRGCKEVLLEDLGVKGRTGLAYGATAEFVRLDLICRDSDFELALERLAAAA